jgi:methionyl-tRNA synthetase
MAKDNVPFHTIGFPCTIIGSREPWKLVDHLKSFNWLTYYGGKFSTSQGVGVFMDAALEILPPDVWRYYLIANAPESDDSSFTWETLAVSVNKDLADTFGNFVNRALTFTERRFGGEVPDGGADGSEEQRLRADIDAGIAALTARLGEMEFRKAAAELRALWARGNEYFDRKQPWAQIKTDRDDAAVTLRTCINLIVLFARLSAPVMPFTAEGLLDALGVPADARNWPDAFDPAVLPAGHSVSVPGVLFAKLTDDDVAAWRERFGGPEAAAA